MKKFILISGMLIIIVGGLFYTFAPKQENPHPKTSEEISILPVHRLENQSFTYIQSFIGSVQAIQSVAVVPYLSGFLKEVLVHAGQEVKKGETLFLLDERISLANLNQAKEAAEQAYATRANALSHYERMKKTDSKAISSLDLEQAKTEYEAADAAYQKAVAGQNQAQTLYDYTIIKAPISGWVGNISATVGEYLSPESKSLATIIGFSPIRLSFSVPLSHKRNNLSFTDAVLQVILSDNEKIKFSDFEIMQDNRADEQTDSLSFFVDVPNNDRRLIPGGYAEINFLYSKTGILVDKNWIHLSPDGAVAFILSDNKVVKKNVEIYQPIQNQYWIKSGLHTGDNIITINVSPNQIGQQAKGVKP